MAAVDPDPFASREPQQKPGSATAKPGPSAISPLDYYRVVRSQIEHEDNLINQRLSWSVAAQSFLFTANAIVLSAASGRVSSDLNAQLRLLEFWIPVLGICSCALPYLTLVAAALAIRDLRNMLRRHASAWRMDDLPQGRRLTQLLGLTAPLLLPLVFMLVWVLLLARAIW